MARTRPGPIRGERTRPLVAVSEGWQARSRVTVVFAAGDQNDCRPIHLGNKRCDDRGRSVLQVVAVPARPLRAYGVGVDGRPRSLNVYAKRA